jgi:trans-aconitate 2-methyltransferase
MPWDPDQYLKFKEQRFAPFADLCALVRRRDAISAIDLGCGTGELTRRLADSLTASTVLGIDNSERMLEQATAFARDGLSFSSASVAEVNGSWDLVISNAVLQWIEDHRRLIPQLVGLVKPGGQLLVQVPSNERNPSHASIRDVAAEEPFCSALEGWVRISPVLEIDAYAAILNTAGICDVIAFEKVYCHQLPDSDAIAEWTRGTTLIPYLERLSAELQEQFLERYRARLREFWPSGPVLYTFRRTFFGGTRTGEACP